MEAEQHKRDSVAFQFGEGRDRSKDSSGIKMINITKIGHGLKTYRYPEDASNRGVEGCLCLTK